MAHGLASRRDAEDGERPKGCTEEKRHRQTGQNDGEKVRAETRGT